MKGRGYWFAFLVGVTAGASVALLYAPQTGEKTRKRLRKGINEAGDYLEDASDYLRDQAERLSKEANRAYKRTRGQVGDVVDRAGDAVNGAVKRASSLM